MLDKNLGYIHFWATIVSAYGVFFLMLFLGLAGVPRRYYANTEFPMFNEMYDINELITVFALIAGVAQIFFIFNVFYSIFKGPKAPQNPWQSTTLEWTTPVKHLHGNWPGEIPEVHRWAYDYSKPDSEVDFIPQTVPLREGEEDDH